MSLHAHIHQPDEVIALSQENRMLKRQIEIIMARLAQMEHRELKSSPTAISVEITMHKATFFKLS